MMERFNFPSPPPPMGRTENNSATYISSGNPCLDFFFQVVPDTPSRTLTSLLESAWSCDPLKSLKLVCHLRGVRGTGKSDKEGFYSAAIWIHNYHPKTLALNIAPIVGFGYMKDLPEILHRILNGERIRNLHRERRRSVRSRRFGRFRSSKAINRAPKTKRSGDSVVKTVEAAATTRREKRASAAKKAIERYERDPDYRFLYDLVCDFFAASLAADMERLKSGKLYEIGDRHAAGALLPHEILAEAHSEVAELQWRRMVSDLQEKGKLKNCIAVCDVSGSMSGTPMDVCVALGMLVAELSEEPWKGKVITFSAAPQLHLIEGETLAEKTSFVREMNWGMNTDLQAVFDRILEVAVEGGLEAEKMIKRMFVFSDMEFDQASARLWETDYMVIRRKFEEKGYGSVVPDIVFWNLRDSRSTPVRSMDKGVALVSGFSKNLLKLFLEGDGVIDPEIIMEAAIAGEEYSKLVVFDLEFFSSEN
ncbi:hypothetical protein QJS04_geneDACA021617 [Acorus gramineus]|uniref:DUF2828 domain-containing protein n=1 Tax=Acorus gramineus TaxID=55184 RepID=A0AAV9B2J3_ACOGR|nr:hypothetical protein QJS04_geneDACA021617 [Acorus gramineus]